MSPLPLPEPPPHFRLADELERIGREYLPWRSPRRLAVQRAAKLLREAGAESIKMQNHSLAESLLAVT